MQNPFADRVEWELTRACDLRCRHCFNRPGRARRRELDTDEALAVAASLARLGCRAVTLSGGEPLLRPDWPQLAAALSRAGVIVQLLSNGQRLGRLEARLARAAGVGAVHLSLDGLAATHDAIRGSDGAFQRLTRAAEHLTDAGVPVGFITTLLRPNVDELEPLGDWVTQWDPVSWQVWMGIPQDNGALWLPPSALPGIVTRLTALKGRTACLTIGDNVGCIEEAAALRRVDDLEPASEAQGSWHCEAGRGVLGLRSDGQVTGCLALPQRGAVGNLRQVSLLRLARQASDAREQRLAAISGGCRDCRHVAECGGGCHATALAARGALDNPFCAAREAPRPARRRAGVARATAGLVVAAALGGSCGPKEDPRTARAQRPAPTASDAGTPAADAAPPPEAAPPKARPPAKRAARQPPLRLTPFRHRGCMTSHVGCYHLRRFPRKGPLPRPKKRP